MSPDSMGRDSNGVVAGSPGSQPFLTQAQRAAMDAAIAAKQQGAMTAHPCTLHHPAAAEAPPSPGKYVGGKNKHQEHVKTKRDVIHDHHLSRRGSQPGKSTCCLTCCRLNMKHTITTL